MRQSEQSNVRARFTVDREAACVYVFVLSLYAVRSSVSL